MDGNESQRRNAHNATDRREYSSSYFLSRDSVNHFAKPTKPTNLKEKKKVCDRLALSNFLTRLRHLEMKPRLRWSYRWRTPVTVQRIGPQPKTTQRNQCGRRTMKQGYSGPYVVTGVPLFSATWFRVASCESLYFLTSTYGLTLIQCEVSTRHHREAVGGLW
jgi:hypothetical protein